MLHIIVFVLAIECVVIGRQAKADDPNYSYSNNLISYAEKFHGVPLKNDFKAYLDNLKHRTPKHDDKSAENRKIHPRMRMFDIIKQFFKKKEAKPPSTTSTTTSNPLNQGLFKRVTTTTSGGFTKKVGELNWLNTFDRREYNKTEQEPGLESELPTPIPDIFDDTNEREATQDEEIKDILKKLIKVLTDLNAKLDRITFTNINYKEAVKTPYAHISTEHSDLDYVERTRYKRQVDNIENIPVEVKPLSVENNSTEYKQNATKIKAKIKRHVTNKKIKKGNSKEMHIKIKNENELTKNVPLNSANINIHNLTLGEILTEIKKGNSSYGDNITKVNANVSDGKVNDSKIFKIRVKRKVNETQLNVLGQALSDKSNVTNRTSEVITRRNIISNVTKVDVENATSSKEDHIQETPKNCNESKQFNGRRAYNRDDDETASGVKQKLLQYMEETFTEIFNKIRPLQDIKRSFGTQDMYRMGYIVANIDTLDTNLRNLKTELESNKDLWSDKKIMDIFDKIMTTNKIVSNLLAALQAFTLHETSSVRPFVPYGQNYYSTQQPELY